MDFGNRPDGTKKSAGYFGVIKRPDGNVMSEVSIGVSLEGKETLLPLIVPTLNKQEMDYLMQNDPKSKTFMSKLPSTIIDKAVDHAVMRMKEGKSPFADPNEPVAKLPR